MHKDTETINANKGAYTKWFNWLSQEAKRDLFCLFATPLTVSFTLCPIVTATTLFQGLPGGAVWALGLRGFTMAMGRGLPYQTFACGMKIPGYHANHCAEESVPNPLFRTSGMAGLEATLSGFSTVGSLNVLGKNPHARNVSFYTKFKTLLSATGAGWQYRFLEGNVMAMGYVIFRPYVINLLDNSHQYSLSSNLAACVAASASASMITNPLRVAFMRSLAHADTTVSATGKVRLYAWWQMLSEMVQEARPKLQEGFNRAVAHRNGPAFAANKPVSWLLLIGALFKETAQVIRPFYQGYLLSLICTSIAFMEVDGVRKIGNKIFLGTQTLFKNNIMEQKVREVEQSLIPNIT